jgi:hypothetical protein
MHSTRHRPNHYVAYLKPFICGARGGRPYPVAVQADGTAYWAAGRAAVMAG